jgi:hypothetical protein
MSTFEAYPAWRFGPEGASVVVLSPEEDGMLGKDWSDKVPENFDPVKAPTYQRADMVVKAVDVEAIAEAVVRRKPGPKPKAA